IAFSRHHDNSCIPCTYLLDIAHHLLVHMRGRRHPNQWSIRVKQRNRAVFEFTGWEALRVNIRDLLELQRTLQGRGIAYAASDKDHTTTVRHTPRQRRNHIIDTGRGLEHLLNLVRNMFQGHEQLLHLLRFHSASLLTQPESHQVKHSDRTDKSLCSYDTNLWPSLQVK